MYEAAVNLVESRLFAEGARFEVERIGSLKRGLSRITQISRSTLQPSDMSVALKPPNSVDIHSIDVLSLL